MNPERRIWDVVKDIRAGRFLLPNIQRPFVWEREQAQDLIDSILRGYPIGALLVWKPEAVPGLSIRCRKFLDRVEKTADLRSDLLYDPEGGAYLVLDGQQRLQSLYLAFFGSWEGERLYLNVKRIDEDESARRRYDLEFFPSTNPPHSSEGYYLLEDLIKLTNPRIKLEFKRQVLKETGRLDDDDLSVTIDCVIDQFQAMFNSESRLLFQEIDEGLSYNEVLEVFTRVNSGGTKLEASDLAFAIVKLGQADLEDKIYDLLDTIRAYGFESIGTDFLIKAALLILGRGAKYDLTRMDHDFLADFACYFDALQKAMDNTMEFLVDHCKIQSDRFLRSPNALIPILDYLMRQRGQDFPQGARDKARTYLYMSQFFRLFSRGTDAVLNRLHELMPGSVSDNPQTTHPFPLDAIAKYMTERHARPFQYDPSMLRDLDIVLNIVHGGVKELPKRRGWSLERDHIFPRKVLEDLHIPEELIDDVGNLRFETKARNIRKSDNIPEAAEFFGGDDPKVKKYFEQARADLTLQDYSAFAKDYKAFVEGRRALIAAKVCAFVGI